MANLNLNKVILGGRMTADPEFKTTPAGTPVLSFTIAVNRRRAKDGDQQSDFITCVAWDKRAELISKHFHKGSCICVVGELQVRKWQDSNGGNRYSTEVLVSEVNFVDSKSESATPSYMPEAYTAPADGFVPVPEDDDIPF
jgi:single-strand DNA-binding protein